MFQVEFAPDAVCQLERLMSRQLESGGRPEAYEFLERLESCIAVFRENPLSGGVHISEIPKRYWAGEVLPGIFLVYQIDEESRRVKIDGVIEEHTEISN